VIRDTHVRYRPAAGGWWVASEGAAVAVLAPVVTETAIAAVWRGIGDGGLGAVLESLTGAFGTSLTAIPPFALAVAEPGGVRVAVRGTLAMLVEGEAAEEISGEGVATWTERFIPGATRVSIGALAEASGPLVPLRSGVAVTDLVVVDVAGAGGADASGAGAAAAPSAAAQISADVTAATADPWADEAGAAAEEAEDAVDAPVAATDAATGEADATGLDTLMPLATAAPEVEQPADEYDLLWGETVARPISAAAVAVAEEGADAPPAPSAPPIESVPLTPAHVSAAPATAPAAAPAAQPATDATDAAAQPPATQPALGDHDGETVSVAQVRALRNAERERYESTDNVPARRPTRGRIVLSTGRIVEIERPVIIGRRPKSTRTSGSDLPTLVAVDSPEQDISRSHVEIRAEGEHVLVTDLDTTNGTVLLRGGQDPVRLHPSEPTMVVTGDVLDLGDGVTVTFEDLA